MNKERGLTVGELVNKLLEIPNQEQRVVMAARHPAAYGVECNVPDKFSVYRGTKIKN